MILRKAFAQNIIFLVLLNLIVKPIWIFGIDRNVQNIAGHETYGVYMALLNLTVIFQVVLDFGLQHYNNRRVAQDPNIMSTLFPNILIIKLVLSAVFIALVLGLGGFLGYFSNSFLLLFLLVVMQIMASFHLFFRSNISAMQKFRMDSFFSVLDRLLVIGIMAVVLFIPAFKSIFKIEWFALAQLIAFMVTATFALIICVRFIRKRSPVKVNMGMMGQVLRQSLPYALLIFLMAIYMKADVILLEQFSNIRELAGKYAAAGRLLDVGNNMTGVLFAGILLPLFGKMLANKEDFRPIIHLTVNILLPISFAAVIVCYYYGKEILDLLYNDMNDADAQMLWILMLTFPCYCINYIYSTLLTANGNIRVLVWISFIAVLINLSLNILFIYNSGSSAGIYVAMVAAITLFFTSIANIFFCIKFLSLNPDLKWVLKLILFGITIFLTAFLLTSWLHALNLAMHFGILGTVFLTALFTFRLFSFADLSKFINGSLRKQ